MTDTAEALRRQLTLEEVRELELRYDGPIPAQAMADVIATRPTRDARYLVGQINDRLQSIKWHRTEAAGPNLSEWMTGYHKVTIDRMTREIDALRAELAALTPAMAAE